MSVPTVRLRSKHDRRIREGHPWVFSNELEGDVSALPPGGAVDVLDAAGRLLGRGYANPRSLISVRLLSRTGEDIDGPELFVKKLRAAVARREAVAPGRRSLRLVHGEGDDLPGLVIDRYDDVLSVQIGTLGMEVRKDALAAAIAEVLAPRAAVLRSEGPARRLEGLEDERGPWLGEAPEHVDIDELGVRFRVPVLSGQKTGHFYDQAYNRAFAGPLCRGRAVLDVYANAGGWALHALVNGATAATAIDRSEACGEQMRVNAALNGVALDVIVGDAMEVLRELPGRAYGAVVLDPPAFAKSRKAAVAALRGYRELNALGAALVEPGGLLFTSSCSWHVEEGRFLEAVVAGARDAKRRVRVVRRGEQGPDHPVPPEVPETRYLKSLALLVD